MLSSLVYFSLQQLQFERGVKSNGQQKRNKYNYNFAQTKCYHELSH